MALNKKRMARLLRTFLIALLLCGAIYVLGWSKLISVKTIAITGTNQSSVLINSLSAAHIELREGMPLARVDVRAINRISHQLGWISKSNISRNWLNGSVSIQISERVPVATYLDDDGSTKYFDATGNSFSAPVAHSGLPAITFSQSSAQTRIAAASWVAAMPSDLLSGMQSLQVENVDQMVMKTQVTSTDSSSQKVITINWGAVRDMPLKVKVLRALLLRPENEKRLLFDLTNPLAPITR